MGSKAYLVPGDDRDHGQHNLACVSPVDLRGGALYGGSTAPQAQCQAFACLLVPLVPSLYNKETGAERIINLRGVTQLVDGEARFSPIVATLHRPPFLCSLI